MKKKQKSAIMKLGMMIQQGGEFMNGLSGLGPFSFGSSVTNTAGLSNYASDNRFPQSSSVTGTAAFQKDLPKVAGIPSASSDSDNSRTQKAEKKGECQTCKNRQYVDGSNEGNVSFKAPGHIAPEASAATVMAHEKEHVANARRTGNKPGNELVSVSVSLKHAICPECGRSYVAGGTTRTLIKYGDSKYDNNRKNADKGSVLGMNVDYFG